MRCSGQSPLFIPEEMVVTQWFLGRVLEEMEVKRALRYGQYHTQFQGELSHWLSEANSHVVNAGFLCPAPRWPSPCCHLHFSPLGCKGAASALAVGASSVCWGLTYGSAYPAEEITFCRKRIKGVGGFCWLAWQKGKRMGRL